MTLLLIYLQFSFEYITHVTFNTLIAIFVTGEIKVLHEERVSI